MFPRLLPAGYARLYMAALYWITFKRERKYGQGEQGVRLKRVKILLRILYLRARRRR